jgi:guanosine-3',5'-bis(diphosphate) 3'-pyrophosphohydrolase
MLRGKLGKLLGKSEKPKKPMGEDPESDLELLLSECRLKLNKFDEQKIKKAYWMCVDGHKNKLRKSGDPFYTHPLSVARIVVNEIPLDDISVVAALLHDIPGDGGKYSLNDLKSEFGSKTGVIIDGIQRIKHVELTNDTHAEQVENYRRLLLSLFSDVRIILIKLGDRLHNMRTLGYLDENSRLKLSKETLDVYAPFANRFGLRNIKWELEDLAFKYINPGAYDRIRKALHSTRKERELYINNIIGPIEKRLSEDDFLKRNKVKFDISGRAKHIYSIYNKMQARSKDIDELHDLFAIRIILDTEDDFACHYVYGIIGSLYKPVPETFKDYISAPKQNGYRSLHTAMVTLDNRISEVQFRTRKMHEYAEQGFAAHFKYKSGQIDPDSILEDNSIQDWMYKVRGIFEGAGSVSNEELIENVKKNLFLDEIYVYTPKQEFRTLPIDSTPLDFAFSIHSEIGIHYIGAKVNGRVAPMGYKLKSGDQVEILTSENHFPEESWLDFAVTPKAKSAITKYLKDQNRKLEEKGKAIWIQKSSERKFELSEEDFDNLVKSLNFPSRNEFYKALVMNKIDFEKAFDFINYKIRKGLRKSDVYPGKGSNGHLKFVHADLFSGKGPYTIEFKIFGLDRPFLVNEITDKIVIIPGINVLAISYEIKNNTLEMYLKVRIFTESKFNKIKENINSVKEVKNVELLG